MVTELVVKATGWRKSHPVVFFVASFAAMMGVFYLFYFSITVQTKFFPPLVGLYARLSSAALNLLQYQTHVSGNGISSTQFAVDVKAGCDAVEPMALFVAGVLAFPVAFRKKISGLVAGVGILFVINLIRIITLFIAGVHSKSLFETMHVVVWQMIFILLAVGLWFLWLKQAVKKQI